MCAPLRPFHLIGQHALHLKLHARVPNHAVPPAPELYISPLASKLQVQVNTHSIPGYGKRFCNRITILPQAYCLLHLPICTYQPRLQVQVSTRFIPNYHQYVPNSFISLLSFISAPPPLCSPLAGLHALHPRLPPVCAQARGLDPARPGQEGQGRAVPVPGAVQVGARLAVCVVCLIGPWISSGKAG